MITRTAEISPRIEIPFIVKHARIVGFLLLLPIPIYFFGSQYVPSKLIVPGDIATTANNIMASELLFRLGVVSNLLIFLIDIAMVLVYYQLFKPVDKGMARLMVILNLLAVPIALLNELNQLVIPLLLHTVSSPSVFTADQLHTLVSFFLHLHDTGSLIGGFFWGLWLVPYGLLVFKSRLFPRFIGVLLIIECFGFLIQSFGGFLFPNLNASLALFPAVTAWAELLLPLWLVIKGVNVEEWEKRALASA